MAKAKKKTAKSNMVKELKNLPRKETPASKLGPKDLSETRIKASDLRALEKKKKGAGAAALKALIMQKANAPLTKEQKKKMKKAK